MTELAPLGYHTIGHTIGLPDPIGYNARPAAARKVVYIDVERQPNQLMSKRFRILSRSAQRVVADQRAFPSSSITWNWNELQRAQSTAATTDDIFLSFVYQQLVGEEMHYLESTILWEGAAEMKEGLRPSDPEDWVPKVLLARIHDEPLPSDHSAAEETLPEDERIPEALKRKKQCFQCDRERLISFGRIWVEEERRRYVVSQRTAIN